MKIVFLGTPDFAVPSLRALIDNGYKPIAVFTQPDRPKGRGGHLSMPPVKDVALKHGIPVYQFEKIKSPEALSQLQSLAPDLMVTAAFGQILSAEVLAVPLLGCVNVHGSLLPKYRGAAPIQWAIINGETRTGITTMYTEIGVDTGDIILQKELDISPEETGGQLFERMAALGAEVIIKTVRLIEAGNAPRIKQDHAKATRSPMIDRNTGIINWQSSYADIHNLARALDPWPGAYGVHNGEIMKIWGVKSTDINTEALAGTIITASAKDGLFVACGDGVLEIVELQVSNSRRMSAKEFLRSRNIALGSSFEVTK